MIFYVRLIKFKFYFFLLVIIYIMNNIEIENMIVVSGILLTGVATLGFFAGAYATGLLGWIIL